MGRPQSHRDECNYTHRHTRTHTRTLLHRPTPKSWSLQLLNIPPCSLNLHSPPRLPPLCLHSPGTNTKLSQGHLQDCFGQQFPPPPNSQIASSVTCHSHIHRANDRLPATRLCKCPGGIEISLFLSLYMVTGAPVWNMGSGSPQKAVSKTDFDHGELGDDASQQSGERWVCCLWRKQ